MSEEKWVELAYLYAAGALDGQDLEEFEKQLNSGCSVCVSSLQEAEEALGLMSKSLPELSPPPALKARIMDQIGVTAQGVGAQPSFNWAWAAGGFVMACLVVTLGWNSVQTQKQLYDLQLMVTDPAVHNVQLKGMDASPNASGKLMMNMNDKKCMFYVAGLSPLPEGKVYELWGISGDNAPVPAGTFKVDKNGCVALDLSKLPGVWKFEKFAVTLEPAGGVPQPTGAMHLIGAV